MKKVTKYLALFMLMLAVSLGIPSMEVSAAETQAVAMASETVSTGILGKNGRIQWSYDKSTKTLTITGEDSGLSLSPKSTFSDVETIIVRDCKPSGSLNSLFSGFKYLTTVRFENFDTSDVTDMRYMFFGCGNLATLDVSGFDTSKVTDMEAMFYGCSGLITLDVSGFDTSNVEYMSYMFENCSRLTTLDVSGFDTAKVKRMDGMFENCSSLRMLDVGGFDTSNVTAMGMMFYNCSGLGTLDVSGFDTSNVTGMYCMFSGCSNLTALDVSGFNTSKVKNIFSMFSGCKRLMVIDVGGFDTSLVTDMSSMFYNCQNVLSLDVSNFDTSNVKNMNSMFFNCLKVANLDVSGFDTSKVTNMTYMFANCRNITSLDVSGFDTSNVKVMASVFDGCRKLTALDVSGFNTCGVTNMGGLFRDCNSLTALDVSGFDTSNVVYMNDMFSLCNSLKAVDVSGFDTSQVTTMRFMFYNCSSLTDLDAGGFNTAKVTDMGHMFNGCNTLAVLDMSGFDMTAVTKLENVLGSCNALKFLYTPAVMGEKQTISLSVTLLDAEGESCSQITSDACKMLLIKAGEKQNIEILTNVTELVTGDSLQLTLQVDNVVKRASVNKYYNWSATVPGTAIVSTDGLVTAIGGGSTTIQVNVPGRSDLTAQIAVNVKDKVILKTTEISEWEVGQTGNLTAYVNGQAVDAESMIWSSSNPEVATCVNGKLAGIGEGITTITCTKKNGMVATCKVTVYEKLEITGQPVSQSIEEGNNAVFKVMSIGTNLSYQWQYKLPGGSTWLNSGITGAKTASLTVQGLAVRNGQQYRCVITDGRGNTVTSNAVTLTVVEKTVITNQPTSQTVTEGNSAVFKVTATGANLGYQWQYKNAGADKWFNSGMKGAKTASITVQGTMARNGQQYRCVITNGIGNQMVSNAVTLTVTEKMVITSQPVNQRVTEGDNAVFKVTAKGSSLSYQWQYKLPGGSTWSNSGITGAKTASLTVQGIMVRNSQQYRCIITDGSSNKVTSNAVTLTVTEKLAITSQPVSQSVTENASAIFNITAKGANLSYQWQYKNAGTNKWFNSGMKGATTDSISVQGTAARNGQQYRCIITDGSGNTITSDAVTLTVEVKMAITEQPASQNVTAGESAVFKVTAKGNNISYQWQYQNAGADKWFNSGMKGATTASINVQGTAARNGQKYRCIITDGSGNTVISDVATLTVESQFAIMSQPINQTVAEGANAVFAVTATGSDLSYQWQYQNAGTNKWFNSGMKGAKTTGITVQGTAARNGQKYRCVITDGSGNKVTSNAVTLTVK